MTIQQTYSAIKPDAYSHRQEILDMIEKGGYKLVKGKNLTLTKENAEIFYEEHRGKEFFPGLVDFMVSGPIYAMILEKENCIEDFRIFIGNTNPQKAEDGTIRAIYGSELPHNAIHASDSIQSAQREINLIFHKNQ